MSDSRLWRPTQDLIPFKGSMKSCKYCTRAVGAWIATVTAGFVHAMQFLSGNLGCTESQTTDFTSAQKYCEILV